MRNGGANYRDESRLEHMMRAVMRIKAQLPRLSRATLSEGDDATEIVLYNLQMIGEDANNMSNETCQSYSAIDFKGWSGLRHRLIHDYANIDFDVVWNVIRDDLPQLEGALKPIVDALPKEELPANIGEFE